MALKSCHFYFIWKVLVNMCKRVVSKEVKIRILVLEPGKKPYEKEIRNNITEIYSLVYYPYIEIPISENLTVIASKEPGLEDFKFNRKVRGIEIYGRCVVVAKQDTRFISLSELQVRKYRWKGDLASGRFKKAAKEGSRRKIKDTTKSVWVTGNSS